MENSISKFHCREDTILYASCFDANAGIFEAILTPEDAVFSDELNHASIIDGLRLCKAKKERYLHRNMKDLEEKLKASDARTKLIVTDGVFSMDGNIAPLPEIVSLAKKYGALTFVDDCHATGFFGKTGRGTEDFYNMIGSVDIINSTLGKALGGKLEISLESSAWQFIICRCYGWLHVRIKRAHSTLTSKVSTLSVQ